MPGRFIEIAALTDAGSVRQFNEDAILADADAGIAVLADGMGGHRAGEVASRMAARVVFEHLQSRVIAFRSSTGGHSALQALDESINRANKAVFEASQASASHNGMGTTLAVTLFYDNRVALGHIGDSRIYRLRDGALTALTRDDSLLREEIDRGWIAAAAAGESHNRSLVTRALGVEHPARAHLAEDEAREGDVYVVCSDGLNDLVDDSDIALILSALHVNLPLAAVHLVQAAKDNGGYDNVSVILAKVLRPFPARSRQRWGARWFGWLR
ncbi:MAG TPA: protein phosphatase 2C domain-containing protein [Casimicrobiaceae bacterium]|jgi:protein phosphatase|nr:protein phosphatase 2C domain-containing protein [Casimicrobiaceae bacterium]